MIRGFLLIVFGELIVLTLFAVFYYILFMPPVNESTFDRSLDWSNFMYRYWYTPNTSPIQRIFITYTVDQNITCYNGINCTESLLGMLRTAPGTTGIPENFIIGDDGYIYEGRGFNITGYAMRHGYMPHTDDSALFISFVDNYNSRQPSELQKNVLETFLVQSIESGFVAEDYIMFCQSNTSDTGEFGEFLQIETKSYERNLNVEQEKIFYSTDFSSSRSSFHAKLRIRQFLHF